ncbi:MAG: ankyrin repeat domain-containing protein [Bacteroidota bacterium]
MIQPNELKPTLRMDLSNGASSTTTNVWDILVASRNGDLDRVKQLVDTCPELIYAQYNYTPPIHFAVREGHLELVKYLLGNGAHDPTYRIYPFLDNLNTIARDRDYYEIADLLDQYGNNPAHCKYRGDNGKIYHSRTDLQRDFQKAVDSQELTKVEEILKQHPEFVHDDTFFWGEGILMKPAKDSNIKLLTLLMSYGARVPDILKWAQEYYFKHPEPAAFLMENGMNPNVMSWQHVTLLHDMAQKGNIPKAELLIKHGAEIDPIDEEYQSTPLGMAVRWGHTEMVNYLLQQGADPNKSGAAWATPLKWAQKKGHQEIEDLLLKTGAK